MPLNYAIFPQSGLGNGPNHSLPAVFSKELK
jgi:hypothetical protein